MLRAFHSAHPKSNTRLFHRTESYLRHVITLILTICCLLLWVSASLAQDIKNGQNAADFKQRSDVHVDPSTLSMQLQIPLGSYSGRGQADIPITLYYSPKLWRMDYVANYINEGFSTYRPAYGESSASGWTSSLDWFKWPSANSTYPNGVDMRLEKYDANGNPVTTTTYSKTVARIHVVLPDGSRHELRREDTILAAGSNTTTGTFLSVDGSRLRYESSSRMLYMPDGSRLIYSYNTSGQPDYIYYIDRNSNYNTYSYATNQWTDSMGRVYNLPPLTTSEVRDYDYQVPGVNGSSLTYTFRWRSLSTVLTDMSQPLRYVGDRTWNYPYSQSSNPALFTSPVDDQRVISNSTAFNPVVLYQIVLPNYQTYTFTYNVWGEIDKIVYPTGAYESFSYATVESLSAQIDDPLYSQINRGVTNRSVSPSGQGGDNQNWTYGTALDASAIPYKLTRAITNPDGSYQQIWFHTGRGQGVKFGFEDERAGKAFDERVYTANPGSGGVMVRRSLTDWTFDYTTPLPSVVAYRNARPQKKIEVLLDTGGNALAATTAYQYDGDLNVVSTTQYNYASVTAATGQTGASSAITTGTPISTSETTYLVNDATIDSGTRSAYRSRQLIGLPTSTRIKNSSGAIVAQSSISYDEAAYPPISLGTVTGWADPMTTVRGNATTVGNLLDTTGAYIQTHSQYDQCGNLINSWDAKGNLTQTLYSSTYAYSYPTNTISPIPDTGNNFCSTTSLQTSTAYDYSTGLVTSTTDANGQTTSYLYSDPLNRLTSIIRPTGGGSTTYTYNDVVGSLWVRTQTEQSASVMQDVYQNYDNMGRPYRSFQYENSDPSKMWLTSDTQYDVMNRVWRVSSNAYRASGGSAAINPSGNWTTTNYDKLGRVTSVTTSDNAVVTTSYSGNQVTVTDQAGKTRRSVTDAVGKLTQIIEDPNNLAYQTDYTYDALGNLRSVLQGTQSRYFMYDSFSRLIRARNPEQSVNANLALTDAVTGNAQWSMAYAYDNNGNLSVKTDARNVTATYTYDNINRNTAINYSDGPIIHHIYDSATNGRGRSRGVFYYANTGANSQTVTNNYDAMGRPLDQLQSFYANGSWGTPYTVSRTYDLAGHVTSQTYPSARTVNYTYDVAGRTASFTGNLGDSVSRTYMTALAFDDSGRMTREQFGTDIPLYHKQHWNRRGQLYDMRLSSVNDDSNWNRGAIINYYSLTNWCFGENCTGTDTNGNLQIQQHYIPNDDAISGHTLMQENYAYDTLNRITWVGEYMNGSGATPSGSQGYDYDRYGNRTINVSTWGTGINAKQFTVDASTNRLGVPAGQSGVMQYDAAGNVINDTYTSYGLRTYDAESRMLTASDSGGGQSIYTYDGDGKRVRRQTGGQETWYVYGIEGELVAEYAANTSPTTPQKEYGYRNSELLITATAAPSLPRTNFALASNGGVASASSSTPASDGMGNYQPSAANNGERLAVGTGDAYSNNTFWRDGTADAYPDWLEIDFNGTKTINEIDVYSLQDDYHNPVEPTESTSFTNYGITAFDVQYWNGSGWATVPGGSVSGNNKVWRKFTFADVTTNKVRVVVNQAQFGRSRVVELEAYGTAAPTNVALASNGGMASASSTTPNNSTLYPGYNFQPSVTIDGDRRSGLNFWRDDTQDAYPDWLEVDFNSPKSLTEIDVFTLQDNDQNPAEPTEAMSFSLYGITAFDVQYWNGSGWVTVPGGSVSGNNKVWRKLTFAAITTSKIRVLVNNALMNRSRIVEVEAYEGGTGSGSSRTGAIEWMVVDQLGTPRMIADKSGSLGGITRHDYLPFGEELMAGSGNRTVANGYVADGVRQKFTGKERDTETGLDYFLARYYSSTQGRFTSPDEFKGGPEELFEDVDPHDPLFYAEMAEPQSLNKYHYCLNNPLRYIDPDGHQTTTADALHKAGDFLGGVGKGIVSSFTHGLVGAPSRNDSNINRAGQVVGTVIEGVTGNAVINVGGGGLTVGTDGAALLTGVPEAAVVTGVSMIVGAGRNIAAIATTPVRMSNQSQEGGSGERQQTGGEEKPPRERSVEGTRVQRENIEHAQRVNRRAGRPDRIRSIEKSKQNEKAALKKIRSLKDAEEP